MPIVTSQKKKPTMHGTKAYGQRGHVLPKAPPAVLDKKDLWRTKHVLFVAKLSHSRLYEKIAAGTFPPPDKQAEIRPGKQRTGGGNLWRPATILAYLEKHKQIGTE